MSTRDLDRYLWTTLPAKCSPTAPDKHEKATLELDKSVSLPWACLGLMQGDSWNPLTPVLPRDMW